MAERQPSRVQTVSSRKRTPKAAKPAGEAVAVERLPDGAGLSDDAVTDQSTGKAASAMAALEAECNRLRFELDAARERIALLESSRKEVLDRIAWVIDSLHSLEKD